MKDYTYYILPPTGSGKTKSSGNLFDLLESIPYLLLKKRLPPLSVVNSILKEGLYDAGMSGGSEWVNNREYFHIWEFERDHGVPAMEHKKLSDEEHSASKELDIAIEQGKNEEELSQLHIKAYNASNAVCELLDRHMK